MIKFNISDEELDLDIKNWFDFKLKKDKFLNKLFWQILYNIYDVEGNQTKEIVRSECNISILLPPNIAIELEAKYSFYCEKYKQDLEQFYLAFIHANKLYDYNVYDNDDRPVLSFEEQLKRDRAAYMANYLDQHNFNKQLEYKEDK